MAATLDESDCGADALGAPGEWSFDIQLSRDDGALYWNQGGSAVEGTVEPDGRAFRFESTTTVELDGESGINGCTMLRVDRASGTLDDAGLDVHGFTGVLSYTYDSKHKGGCSALVGVPNGFQHLPCSMTYRVDARRNLAPSERHR